MIQTNMFVVRYVVLGVVLLTTLTASMHQPKTKLPIQYTKMLPLSEFERTMTTNTIDISTLTFYQGNVHHAADQLSKRVAKIVAVNPWLGGRLCDITGTINVHYDDQKHPECFVMNERVIGDSIPPIGSLIGTYYDYGKHPSFKIGDAGRGTKLLNNFGPSGALFGVTLTPINDDSFVVRTSMQHAIGDGHTFYAINHMLSSDGCVTALDTTRHQNLSDEAARLLGKQEVDLMMVLSPCLLIGYLVNMLCRKSGKLISPIDVAVNGSAMEEKKKQAAAGTLTKEVDSFVSTNDILTSVFFKAAKTSVNFMCMDMRRRIKMNQHDLDKTAGNLEQFMMYRPSDVVEPSLIRKSLRTMKRAATPATPMPGFWDMITGNTGLVSNWATFYKGVKIKRCKQIIHIPLPDASMMVPFKRFGIIFRPSNDRLALLSNGDTRMMNDLEQELGSDVLIKVPFVNNSTADPHHRKSTQRSKLNRSIRV